MSNDTASGYPIGTMFTGQHGFAARPPGAPLRSLADHNAERRKAWEERQKPQPTGLACPACGKELLRPTEQPGYWQTLAIRQGPSGYSVVCSDRLCDWTGDMLV